MMIVKWCYKLTRVYLNPKKLGGAKAMNNRTIIGQTRAMRREANDYMDYNKKILHASYHPRENTIAVAATNNLFIFT